MASEKWFADEAFWKTFSPFMFSEAAYRSAGEQIGALLDLLDTPAGTVLDLACGAGRHSIPLAQRGFSVTAVDRSGYLLQRAIERGRSAGLDIEWVEADMADFVRPGAFELALNLATSFGYFPYQAENERVLQNVHASLSPGGTFVIELTAKEVLPRVYQPTRSIDLPDGIVVQRQKVVEAWSQMANEWLMITKEGVQSFRFQHWIYSAHKLRQMLLRMGFGSVEMFGDFSGAPYDAASGRLVACVRKVSTPGQKADSSAG